MVTYISGIKYKLTTTKRYNTSFSVIMDGDEIEMSEEELQKWIREEVDKSEVIFPGVLEKCKMLQSLLKKREKQAAHLLKLCGYCIYSVLTFLSRKSPV